MTIINELPSYEDSGLYFSGLAKETKVVWPAEFEELKTYYGQVSSCWHEKRTEEFMLGRYLIHTTLKDRGCSAWDQPIVLGPKREPLFPASIKASLTHNKNYVLFALATDGQKVGIDVESRERLKTELARQILTEHDEKLINLMDENRNDLLTLIFSAKEACYKTLYPIYQEYFGFKDAYFSSLDWGKQTYELVVTKEFEKSQRDGVLKLSGHFIYDDENILTYIVD